MFPILKGVLAKLVHRNYSAFIGQRQGAKVFQKFPENSKTQELKSQIKESSPLKVIWIISAILSLSSFVVITLCTANIISFSLSGKTKDYYFHMIRLLKKLVLWVKSVLCIFSPFLSSVPCAINIHCPYMASSSSTF